MARKSPPTPKSVTPDTIDPRHRWDRPLQAPGHMPVDFEERVDFRRLQGYRLARVRQALARSDLGALLVFDPRSEEHTSELQSQSKLVCRLLLEKKNIRQ